MATQNWSGFSGGSPPNDINAMLTYDDVTFALLAAVYWNQTSFLGKAIVIDPQFNVHTFALAPGSGSSSSPVSSSLAGLGLTMVHATVTNPKTQQQYVAVNRPAGWQIFFQWPA